MKFIKIILLGLPLLIISAVSHAERVKDISQILGFRTNQLIGYGLIVGLDGTGDQNNFTNQSFKTMLGRLGVQLPAGVSAKSKNIAAVVIHASLPPFAKPGQHLDITVSSIGDAKSLRGGSLLVSELKGLDGKVYAVAQGNLVVGGFGAEGADGSKITVNIPVVGKIPRGAIIERESPSNFAAISKRALTIMLNKPDFTTAQRMSEVINDHLGNNISSPVDAATVNVIVPEDVSDKIKFLSVLENLKFVPGEDSAKIIINSRTGTIVIGQHVKVASAAVSHGSLTVTISEAPAASQPQPFSSGGTTEIVQNTTINIAEEQNKMFVLPNSVSLNSIVSSINEVGASPGDLMAILEALREAGSINANIEVI